MYERAVCDQGDGDQIPEHSQSIENEDAGALLRSRRNSLESNIESEKPRRCVQEFDEPGFVVEQQREEGNMTCRREWQEG